MSKWSKREIDTLLYLHYNESQSYSEIADKLTRQYGVQRSYEAVRKKVRQYTEDDAKSLERPLELDLCAGMYAGDYRLDGFYDTRRCAARPWNAVANGTMVYGRRDGHEVQGDDHPSAADQGRSGRQ